MSNIASRRSDLSPKCIYHRTGKQSETQKKSPTATDGRMKTAMCRASHFLFVQVEFVSEFVLKFMLLY